MAARTTFLWGLKRSGIHLLVGWLYANLGAHSKGPLANESLHPQLCDGFADEDASVAFVNNCGGLHSRRFALGDLQAGDFRAAANQRSATIFGIEDCSLAFAERTEGVPDATHLLLLRDPLNHMASRLEAATTRPEVFPINEAFVDLLDAYCAEFLGRTARLEAKTLVSYNRFVTDRHYRDELAAGLGLPNHDAISEVSGYGGGSSFSGTREPSPTASLLTRFHQHPLPPRLLDRLLERSSIGEACVTVFHYDLAELSGPG